MRTSCATTVSGMPFDAAQLLEQLGAAQKEWEVGTSGLEMTVGSHLAVPGSPTSNVACGVRIVLSRQVFAYERGDAF